jgi:hypothetical protein
VWLGLVVSALWGRSRDGAWYGLLARPGWNSATGLVCTASFSSKSSIPPQRSGCDIDHDASAGVDADGSYQRSARASKRTGKLICGGVSAW